jgi:transcriptional regulator with XRE-family HTH domain
MGAMDSQNMGGRDAAGLEESEAKDWRRPAWWQPPPSTESAEQRTATTGVDPELVGARLRGFRKRNGLTIRQLATRLEVSPSMISQIETGKTQPSVRTLYAIVSELGVSLDEVFAADGAETTERAGEPRTSPEATDTRVVRASSRDRVQRAGERQIIELETGVKWELLATSHEPDIDFIHHIYPVGGSSSPSGVLMRHSGREFGIVLSGRLGVTVAFDHYLLLAGDSILFDSTLPHRLQNEGDEEVHSIWIIYGRNP